MSTTTTYHLFNPTENPQHIIADDCILAGDGVYRIAECFGIRVPVPLLPCEVRGLPPLFPWLRANFDPAQQEPPAFAPTSYHFLYEGSRLPAVDHNRLYQYVVGREGVFLLAGIPDLEVLLPISTQGVLPGLTSISPSISFSHPLIGEDVTLQILAHALAARNNDGQPIEQLYFLLWEEGTWRLVIPEQEAYQDSVRAKKVTPEYLAAVVEGHSHHLHRATFSHVDDKAEVRDGGFRVYFVLGNIFKQPELRVRICVHGYEWEVPSRTFFTLPGEIVDCVAREWGNARSCC